MNPAATPCRYVPWVLVNHIPLFEHDPELRRYVCAAFAGRKPSSCWEPDNIRAAPVNGGVLHPAAQVDAPAGIPPGHSPAGHTPRSNEEE